MLLKKQALSQKDKKVLEYRAKKDEFHVGIPTPWGVAGLSKKKDRSHLTINEQYSKQNQEIVAGLGQKIIEQQLGIQETEEQNQQAQIEQPPK